MKNRAAIRTIIVIAVCVAVVFIANRFLSKPRVENVGPDTSNLKAIIDGYRQYAGG
jgi:hypothetical protein